MYESRGSEQCSVGKHSVNVLTEHEKLTFLCKSIIVVVNIVCTATASSTLQLGCMFSISIMTTITYLL